MLYPPSLPRTSRLLCYILPPSDIKIIMLYPPSLGHLDHYVISSLPRTSRLLCYILPPSLGHLDHYVISSLPRTSRLLCYIFPQPTFRFVWYFLPYSHNVVNTRNISSKIYKAKNSLLLPGTIFSHLLPSCGQNILSI